MSQLQWILGLLLLGLTGLARAVPDPTLVQGIEMTLMSEAPLRSPSRDRWAFVTRQGDLASNQNHYRLYCFEPDKPVRELVTMSTSGNQPGISKLHWSPDGSKLFFLGSGNDQALRPWALSLDDGRLRSLSENPTKIAAFAVSPREDWLALAVYPARQKLFAGEAARQGLWVQGQSFWDLIGDDDALSGGWDRLQLVLVSPAGKKREVSLDDSLFPYSNFEISPDGRYLLTQVRLRHIPANWLKYPFPMLAQALRARPEPGQAAAVWRHILVDLQTGTVRDLVDAPVLGGPSAVFSPDGKKLLVVDGFLPLSQEDPRTDRPLSYILDLDSQQFEVVTDQRVTEVRWDKQLRVRTKGSPPLPNEDLAGNLLCQQGSTQPPVLVYERQGQKRVVLDLNPKFQANQLAVVQEVDWPGRGGRRVKGGLFLPSARFPKPWPLVIQCAEGWDSQRFSMEGSVTTGCAAQALAQHGIAVLEVDMGLVAEEWVTGEEAPAAVESFQNVIAQLSQQGLIDPARVGLTGFSRTCFWVRHALALADLPVAASVICDGIAYGYLDYVLYGDGNHEMEAIFGSQPYGAGISNWLAQSPGFNLDRVRAPVLIQGCTRSSGLVDREWYVGLRRLHQPVEMFLLEDGEHQLVRPHDRLASSQASLDWYRFWLRGEVDAEPGKSERIARWRDWARRLR